jgi:hypothetical protein
MSYVLSASVATLNSRALDRLDEIIKRLARIEKHLGIPDEPPPPELLPVIQYHQFHVDYASGFHDPTLCGFYGRDESRNRLSMRECQEIIDGGNSHVLCPQCYHVFQEKYSREVVRGLLQRILVSTACPSSCLISHRWLQ